MSMPSGQYEHVEDLAEAAALDPKLVEEIRKNPVEILTRLAARPLDTDIWIYRMVVGSLGLSVLIAVTVASILGAYDKKALEILVAIGSASVGALAGLLAPSPVRK